MYTDTSHVILSKCGGWREGWGLVGDSCIAVVGHPVYKTRAPKFE